MLRTLLGREELENTFSRKDARTEPQACPIDETDGGTDGPCRKCYSPCWRYHDVLTRKVRQEHSGAIPRPSEVSGTKSGTTGTKTRITWTVGADAEASRTRGRACKGTIESRFECDKPNGNTYTNKQTSARAQYHVASKSLELDVQWWRQRWWKQGQPETLSQLETDKCKSNAIMS